MASRPVEQGGAAALPTFDLSATAGEKVVRLPTASGRKVYQRWNKHTREEAAKLRCHWRGEHISPSIRAKMEEAQLLDTITPTPALLLTAAIAQVLSDDQKEQVGLILRNRAGPSAQQAEALFKAAQPRTIGDRVALDAALSLIRGEKQP
jgi:hypothetical protein